MTKHVKLIFYLLICLGFGALTANSDDNPSKPKPKNLIETIIDANEWVKKHPEIFANDYLKETQMNDSCCIVKGDFNDDGKFDMIDISSFFRYLFKGGPAPVCFAEADINGDCDLTINDISTGIAVLYKNHDSPSNAECINWYDNCGN